MSNYYATIVWKRGTQTFVDNKYSRVHDWLFCADSQSTTLRYKTRIKASASSHIVPLPYSVEENIDPEEAFVASISSCHMLFYLSFAAKHQFIIDQYEDRAEGILEKNEEGALAMTRVTLKPKIQYSQNKPSKEQEAEFHHLAHKECFIANSIKTDIRIETR